MIPKTAASDVALLVVDDHTLVRESLCQYLSGQHGLRVVGNAHDAESAMERAMELSPDVIVMDIDMPGLICFDAARRLQDLRPDCKILFLSAFVHDSYIDQALSSGARGYVSKNDSQETLLKAIRKVARGELYFSAAVWSRLTVTPKGLRLAEKPTTRLSTLTIREIEILRYIACGLSKKEIAGEMHISEKTVDAHTTNVMAKLDIHDRVELTRFAIREGIAQA